MPDLKINITAGGGQRAAEEVKKLTAATGSLSTATKDAGRETEKSSTLLEQLASRNGEAREAIEGLEGATRGGAAGIFGMAKAIKAITEGLKLNPFSFLAGAAIALVPTLITLGEKLTGTAKESAALGEGAKSAADGFREATAQGDALSKIDLSALKNQLDEIKQLFNDVNSFGDKLDKSKDRLEEAKMGVELAKLNADKTLTPEEKKAAEYEIRKRYTIGKQNREDASRDAKVQSAQEYATGAEYIAGTAADQRDAQAKRLSDIQKDSDARKARIAALEAERAALQKRVGGTSPEANARFERQQEITRQLAQERAREEAAKSPGAISDFKKQQEELAKRSETAKNLAAEAAAIRSQANQTARDASLDASSNPVIRSLQDKAARINSGVPEAPNIPRTPATVQGFGDSYINGVPFDEAKFRSRGAMPLQQPGSPQIQIGDQTFAPVAQKIGQEVGAAAAAALDRSTSIIIDGVNAAIRASEARTTEKLKNARN